MPIIAKESGGGNYSLMPADLHRAVCDMLVDLGVQPGGSWQGKEMPDRHQIYIRWATPDEVIEYILAHLAATYGQREVIARSDRVQQVIPFIASKLDAYRIISI